MKHGYLNLSWGENCFGGGSLNGKREKIGKTHNQKGSNMSENKDIKSRFRRERPESKAWTLRRAIRVILLILLLPIYLIADLLEIIWRVILRIARKFTGKKGEK